VSALLEVEDLRTRFTTDQGVARAVDGKTEFLFNTRLERPDQKPDEAMIAEIADRGTADLPFPGMVAPLLVETPQSTKLIDDVVAGVIAHAERPTPN